MMNDNYNRLNSHSQPVLMGVINTTPDSFSDGGAFLDPKRALARVEQMLEAGAGIIDVGGESTRPGSAGVDEEEETRRVLPLISAVSRRWPVKISIDTSRFAVARQAYEAGATMVNDVSALRRHPQMAVWIAEKKLEVVLMHMAGTPADMQLNPFYHDPVEEISAFLAERTAWALKQGIAPESVIIDPGIGFGKRPADNLALIRAVPRLKQLGFRVLIGLSRKAFLGVISGEKEAAKRDPESLAANLLAAAYGADILRVHDVAGTRKALTVLAALGLPETITESG